MTLTEDEKIKIMMQHLMTDLTGVFIDRDDPRKIK